jgi:hypothetical protein
MNRKFSLTIIFLTIIIYGLVSYSCNGDISLASSPTPAPFPIQSPMVRSSPSPSATVAITATPTLGNSLVITPDDLFAIPGLQALNTPGSANFCEHLPSPQISTNANESLILAGRFLLCPSRSWPWLNMAIDLDNGTLVSNDNETADMVLEYAHVPVDGTISYDVQGLNDGHIVEAKTNSLSYEYCKNALLSMDENDPGIFDIDNGTIACVMTTEDRIAVIRVENIFPLDMKSVEFSFAVLKK